MKTIKIIGLITGIALMCFCSYAQDPIHYTVKDGLPSNHVYTATQDNEGFMWFGTNRGVAKFDGESFKVFTVQDGLPNNDIWLLQSDKLGRIWYGSKSMYQGYIFNDKVHRFVTYDSFVITPKFIHYNDTAFWYGNYKLKKGLLSCDFNFRSVNRKVADYVKSKDWEVNYVANYPIGEKMVILNSKEVILCDSNFNYHKKIVRNNGSSVLSEKRIVSFGMLPNELFYFSFENGIMFLDFRNENVKEFYFSDLGIDVKYNQVICRGIENQIQLSLPNYLILIDSNFNIISKKNISINNAISYMDRQSNIWAYSEKGIFLLHKNTTNSSVGLFRDKKVQKVGKINGEFVVGVQNDAYFISKNQNFKNYYKLKSSRDVYKIDSKGYLISSSGIYLNKGKGFYKLRIPGSIGGLGGPKSFKNYLEVKDRVIIISTGRVFEFNKGDWQVSNELKEDGWLCVSNFKGKIYLGGAKGLAVLNEGIINNKLPKLNFVKSSILSIDADNKYMFIGTDGHGLYVYDNEKLYHVQSTDGFIVQKVINKGGLLWLSTQKGVQCLLLNKDNISASKIVDSYYDSDGLSQNNTNDVFLEDSFLYVATDNGLNRLVLNNPNYKIKPILYFKNIADSMVYSAKEAESLVVNFGAIDFVNQKYLKYFYKIKPSESDWIEIKGKFLNFSHLEHGKYELIVRVVDQHNNENQKKAILVILPQWWETLIAKILIGIGLTFIAWAFFRYYANSNSEKIRLNLEMERKMGNLELLALRSQMNPHFVHNSLNSIQYFVQKKETSESEKYIASFSKLIRKIFELSRRQSLNLKEEVELITEYLEIESLRFEDKLTFAVNLDARINPIKTLIPSMILQPIIENAVNHGVFHKKEKGHISVSFNFVDALSYEVVIEDDGVGIHHTVKEKVITDLKGNRHSTSVLMERIELLKDNSEWDVSYSIIDLKKSTGNNGTRVTLIFNELDNEYI